jgi:uncharacterized protein
MVVRPALTFAIQEIREGLSEQEVEVEAARLGIEPAGAEILGPIGIKLEISRIHDEFRVRGRAALTVRQECVRCLETIEQRIDAALDLLVRPVDVEAEGELDPPEGIIYHDGEAFSLADEVRQLALVEIPANPLCRPACQGLCPKCGGNLNQGGCTCASGGGGDPRWSALAALKQGHAAEKPRPPGRVVPETQRTKDRKDQKH